MSESTLTQDTPHHEVRRRAVKRPTVAALLKAARNAGLDISAIESTDSGVKLIVGIERGDSSGDDDASLDQRMTEQMGVARLSGGKRR
ncbi:MAG: hypothetical protein ABL871_10050 [Terricaulis sp.]